MQVVSAADPQWIFPFAGLKPTRFRRLVRLVAQRGGDRIAYGRPGRESPSRGVMAETPNHQRWYLAWRDGQPQ
ncbi:hypothetical protein FRAHR75_820027 [Frankia sp. Hr75.2]|nr:hypothetical protein FRAHR75_820027 [Frankia sp. Hr75.2]SQE00178.1 hypothetical protein FMEAI12_6230005 [Parafrankia sp. Ea1.12]